MSVLISHLPKKRRRKFTGTVVSDKMQKTLVVRCDRRALHPLYRKYVVVSKHLHVHDQDNAAGIGDVVRIVESRPMSKSKKWRLYQIIKSNSTRGTTV